MILPPFFPLSMIWHFPLACCEREIYIFQFILLIKYLLSVSMFRMASLLFIMYMQQRQQLNLVLSSCYLILVLRCDLKPLNLTCAKTYQKSLLNFPNMKWEFMPKFALYLQLSMERLSSMKKYVFGLGSAQVNVIIHLQSI